MRKRYAACVVVFFVALVCAGAARAATIADLVERVGPSVVYIEGEGGCGSGFVIRTKPHVEILTNHHVMEGGTRYTIYFFVKSERTGEIETKPVPGYAYFAFPRLDFGIIRLEAKDPDVKRLRPRIRALPRGNSQKVRVGERVFLIGSPAAGVVTLGNSVSEGIISGKERHFKGIPYFQTTAPVNFGNSGGPLLNMRGQVIGVVTSKGVFTENIGFALPVHMTQGEHYDYYMPEKLSKEATQLVAGGERLAKKKQYEEACRAFRKAQKLEPGKARPLMAEAFTRNVMGNDDEAIRLLKKAGACEKIKYDDLMQCMLEVGLIHGRAGRTEQAMRAFKAGLAKDPMDAALNRNIGVAYANSGKKAKALAHWYVSLLADPDQPKLKREFVALMGR